MDECTTSELIEMLAGDVSRCQQAFVEAIDEGKVDQNGDVDADYEYHARMLIRSIFAYIEGVTFSVKVSAADLCLKKGIDITDGERFFAIDLDFMLSNAGDVIERPTHIRTSDNVRFAFRLEEKALGLLTKFDPSEGWWSDFKSAIKVRDRLMHPKWPADLNISGDEIIQAQRAYNGYIAQIDFYAQHRKQLATDA